MSKLNALDNDVGLAQLFRAESGRILSVLMLQTRDINLAEDALQEAFLNANTVWVKNGKPEKEVAWLLSVAKRRLIDLIRKESHRSKQSTLLSITENQADNNHNEFEDGYPDERLRLIFTCCHPALADNVRVPLTLKTLCGLSVREIARAYLVSEHAMEQRLTRAKRKIHDVGIAYEVPVDDALKARLTSVLSVVYLIYNESFSAFEGQTLTRECLANEAIRLARLLKALLPCPDVDGLLALLLLHDSRRSTRSSSEHAFIPLEHQDRSKWDQRLIKEGVSLALASLALGKPGPYQVQAAISSLHVVSPNWKATDWQQIQQLYDVLAQIEPSPVVELNRSMAIAYGGDAAAALEMLNELEEPLKNYQPFYVARAELHSLTGNVTLSINDYGRALKLTRNEAEKKHLESKQVNLQSIEQS